jgi:hypothetical protein
MILLGFSFWNTAVAVLTVSLGGLILFIAYRKLLQYMGKGQPVADQYCVLYPLEVNPAKGIIEIYYTSEHPKEVIVEILDETLSILKEIDRRNCEVGGTIVRFDTKSIGDGTYFYRLRTDNQQTMKKMAVKNH